MRTRSVRLAWLAAPTDWAMRPSCRKSMFAPQSTTSTRLPVSVLAVLEHGGQAHGAGGFGDAAQALPQHAHRVADLGVGDGLDAAQRVAADFERQLARLSNRRAVAEQVHLIERHRFSGLERGFHRCLARALDADDRDVRPVGLEPGGNPGRESAAADLEIGGIERAVA